MGCSSSIPSNSISNNILNEQKSNCPRVKLVLLGDSGVGKSCIALQFVKGEFDSSSKVTVGASFLSKIIFLQNKKFLKFEIWDTAGQERYAALAPLYYRGAKIALIIFDITIPETFEKAKFWVKELKKHGNSSAIIALIGNKLDLSHLRRVSFQDAKEYADSNKMIYMETSAKTSQNINELFQIVGEKVPADYEP